jgi:hypothetical protein
LDRLTGIDPDELAFSAAQLEQVAAELREIGSAVRSAAERFGIGPAPAARCAALATSVQGRADEASELADTLRSASVRFDGLLTELVHQVLRAAEQSGRTDSAEPSMGWTPVETPGSSDPVLAALRAGLDSADRLLGSLWCPADTVCPDYSESPEPSGQTEWAGAPAYPASASAIWQPLPSPAAGTPGTGPQLAGTESDRVREDNGVRVATMPDAPSPGRR